eukprot:446166_1
MAATVETGSLPGLQSEREQLKIQEFEALSDKQSEALRAETALALEYQSETKKNNSFMSIAIRNQQHYRQKLPRQKESNLRNQQNYRQEHLNINLWRKTTIRRRHPVAIRSQQ